MAALGGADLVVEAIYEDLDAKRDVFAQLDGACKPTAVLASNTSTLAIDSIADAVADPSRVVGTCVEINQCVGCYKSFLGDDVAVPAPSSGDEPAPPRHRARVAWMA